MNPIKPFATGVQSAGPNTVQATCTCGWRGPERGPVKTADADAFAHAIDPNHDRCERPTRHEISGGRPVNPTDALAEAARQTGRTDPRSQDGAWADEDLHAALLAFDAAAPLRQAEREVIEAAKAMAEGLATPALHRAVRRLVELEQ